MGLFLGLEGKSILAISIFVVLLMGTISPNNAFAPTHVIDFEGTCSSTVDAAIDVGTNEVTLQVGTALGTAVNGFSVTVGNPREAFLVNPSVQPDDTPFESGGQYFAAGDCFYSDDVSGFANGFNFYISFANPVANLSLDLYDYSDDGNFPGGNPNLSCAGMNIRCVGDVATLEVFSDLAQSNSVGSATYTVTDNDVDGQRAFLEVNDPSGAILSASVTFSNPDRGTGIDNITFQNEPIIETAWNDGSDFSGKNWAMYVPFLEDCTPISVDLLAGQDIDAGQVDITCAGDQITITITMENDWELVESHLHVADDASGVPQKNGNPKNGQFDFKGDDTVFQYVVTHSGNGVVALHTIVQTFP